MGVAFYDFQKLRRYAYDEGDLDDDETFIGYNSKTQQMVFDSEGNLLNESGVLELQAQAKFKDILPMPFSFFGDRILISDFSLPLLQASMVSDLVQWAVVIFIVIFPRLDLPRQRSSTLSRTCFGVREGASE